MKTRNIILIGLGLWSAKKIFFTPEQKPGIDFENLPGGKTLDGLNGFFDGVHDLKTLRKLYFDFVKQYHPDRHPGASDNEISRLTEIMQNINSEYDELSRVLPKESGKGFESPEDQENEFHISKVYRDIVNSVLKYDLVKVELISGNTYPIRKELKAAGFMFAPKKKMWYWRPEDKKVKYRGKTQDIEKIRAKYGTSTFDKERTKSLAGLDTDLINSLNALQILLA